jgi:DNA adenine methylase
MGNIVKWHGGKHYLAEWIVSHFPPHLHYVEPFFGGGAVLFARDPGRNWMEGHPLAVKGENGSLRGHHSGSSEVINDIHQELTNFWKVLQDSEKFERLRRRLESTPFSQVEWEAAFEPADDEIERAARFFIRYRQSRQAIGKYFATLSRARTRQNRNEQAAAWLSCVHGLPEAHERLRGVVILCQDAVNVIRTQDGPYTLFYCDPPYVHESRTVTSCYEHEMHEDEHRRLLEALLAVEGKVILSGYHNRLYDEMLSGWRVTEREIDNKSGSGKTKEKRVEVLWMNYG